MRVLALLLVVAPACSRAQPPPSSTTSRTCIRTMSLPDGGAGRIECETARWRGTIEIAADVKVGYQSTSTTTSVAGVVTKTTITVNGHECVIEEDGLRVGGHGIPLSGEVHVEIRTDGVFVDGKRVADT